MLVQKVWHHDKWALILLGPVGQRVTTRVTLGEARVADCPVDLRLPMLVVGWDCLRKAVVRLVSVIVGKEANVFFLVQTRIS